MKKLFTIGAALMLNFATFAQAQQINQPVIKSAEVETSDILLALEMSGYRFSRFDFSEFLADDFNYNFTFYIQEFDGEKLLEPKYFNVGSNRVPISVFPEDQRKSVLANRGLPEDAKYFEELTNASVYFVPKSDSTARVVLNIPGFGRFMPLLKLKPIVTSDFKLYMYESRPFEFSEMKLSENMPLVMYGSGWFDPKYNVCRMCGESVLKPDLSSEIFKDIPHYYIVGVKIEKGEAK